MAPYDVLSDNTDTRWNGFTWSYDVHVCILSVLCARQIGELFSGEFLLPKRGLQHRPWVLLSKQSMCVCVCAHATWRSRLMGLGSVTWLLRFLLGTCDSAKHRVSNGADRWHTTHRDSKFNTDMKLKHSSVHVRSCVTNIILSWEM